MAEFHLKMAGTPPPISMPYWFDCQIRSLPSLVVFIVTHLWFIFIFIIIYMFFLRRRLKRLLYGWASAEYDKSLKALISVLNIEMASYRCYSVGSFEVTNVLTYQLTSVFRIRLWTNTIFILSNTVFVLAVGISFQDKLVKLVPRPPVEGREEMSGEIRFLAIHSAGYILKQEGL